MLCSLSGEPPQVPVASRKSGNIFERRLIEAYIAENGKDPVTGEELTTDDLIELKSNRIVKPRPPTLTSIPSLLSVFQNEWDALALETYTLRQHLAQTRQELSTALYQHDAAVRVIARLTKERDEARDALSRVTVSAGSGGAATNGDSMDVDGGAVPEEIAAKIDATQERLSKTRRKRPVPEGWITADALQTFKPSYTSMALYPGGRSLAVDDTGDLALLGGGDGSAGVTSISQNKQVYALEGARGAITDTLWSGSRAILSTASGQVLVYEEGKQLAAFNQHSGSATSISLHPSGEILASAGEDNNYVLYDLTNLSLITKVYTGSNLTKTSFHPDGHLLALGTTTGTIEIYDVKSGSKAATFATNNTTSSPGQITSLSFSENGTWLATASRGHSAVTIWNLRTMAELRTIELGGADEIDAVRWDYTGQFLAAVGPAGVVVQAYSKAEKEWSEPLRVGTPAVAVEWGPQGRELVVVDGGGVVTVLRPEG